MPALRALLPVLLLLLPDFSSTCTLLNNASLVSLTCRKIGADYQCRYSATDLIFRRFGTCVGLASATANAFRIDFDVDVPVGVSHDIQDCYLNLPCFTKIKVKSDVLALPLFVSSPMYDAFWKWSSPMLAPPSSWVKTVHVTKGVLKPQWLSALWNSSVETLRLTVDIRATHFALGAMPALKTLEVSQTRIHVFLPDNFLAAPNLEELNLSGNRLASIPEGIFQSKKLKKLNVSRNDVERFSLNSRELELLPYLEELDVSFCTIGSLSGEDLPKLPTLQRLFAKGCGIDQCHVREPFRALPGLRELVLSNNSLSEWPDLRGLHLDALDVSGNRLARLPGEYNCTVLGLDLSRNALTEWGSADRLPSSLRALDLSHNQLRAMSDDMLTAFERLQTLRLYGNPFDCERCDTLTLKRWLAHAVTRQVSVEPVAIPCATPPRRCADGSLDFSHCYRTPISVLLVEILVPLGILTIILIPIGYCAVKYKKDISHVLLLCRMGYFQKSPFDR